MSNKTIFIPNKNNIKHTTDDFHWNYGSELINAQNCSFFHDIFPPTGEEHWVFAGSTGSAEKGDWFAFQLSVPYRDQDLMEYTYKLNDGLGMHCSHLHSIPAPPGYTGFTSVDADDAELTIRLDRKAGTVTGEFSAKFLSGRYRLNPNGNFKLTRNAPHQGHDYHSSTPR